MPARSFVSREPEGSAGASHHEGHDDRKHQLNVSHFEPRHSFFVARERVFDADGYRRLESSALVFCEVHGRFE
jgi:hypothetical protein